MKEDDKSLLISGRGFSVQWEKKVNGSMTSLIYKNKEMLAHSDDFPVQPVTQVFRAPTDNDKSFGNWLAKDWKLHGMVHPADKSGIFPTMKNVQTGGHCSGFKLVIYIKKEKW